MKPLELRTSSFRFRNESQSQPWCEDNRVHRVAPLLRFVTFEVIGAVDWCVFLVPLGLAKACVASFCSKNNVVVCALKRTLG